MLNHLPAASLRSLRLEKQRERVLDLFVAIGSLLRIGQQGLEQGHVDDVFDDRGLGLATHEGVLQRPLRRVVRPRSSTWFRPMRSVLQATERSSVAGRADPASLADTQPRGRNDAVGQGRFTFHQCSGGDFGTILGGAEELDGGDLERARSTSRCSEVA